MSKPSNLPRWATAISALITAPSSGKMDSGWTNGEQPAADVWNWLLNTAYQWTQWLHDFEDTAHTWSVTQSFAGTIDMVNSRIHNLFDPAMAQDAATKNYVDGAGMIISGRLMADLTSVPNAAVYVLTPAGVAPSSSPTLVAPFAGTLSNLYVASAGSGDSGSISVGVNGSTSALVCGINPNGVNSDTTHTVSFAAGDSLYVTYTNNDGTTHALMKAGLTVCAQITHA